MPPLPHEPRLDLHPGHPDASAPRHRAKPCAVSRGVTALFAVALFGSGSALANPYATLFEHGNYGGTQLQVTGDIPSLGALGFDNRASSIRWRGDWAAVYKDANFKGECLTVKGDIPSLQGAGFGNDNLSSVRVHFDCNIGPLEIDACSYHPCGAGQLCVDLPRPALGNAEGRQCVDWVAPERPRSASLELADPPNVARDGSLGVSLARGRPTRQSSTYQGAVAARAVDGNTRGDFNAGSVQHTLSEANPWLELFLGETVAVGSVRIHNRTDGSTDRIVGLVAELSEVTCDQTSVPPIARSSPVTAQAATHTFTFEAAPKARFVCLRRVTPGFIQLAEVEVFAPTRTLPNLALGRPARIVPNYDTGSPARLTDGILNTDYSTGQVAHTAMVANNFMEIDLGGPTTISTIVVQNRMDCCWDRLESTVLEVSNVACHVSPRQVVQSLTLEPTEYSPIVVGQLTAPVVGRYVCLRKTNADAINISEIEVYGPETETLDLPAEARASSTLPNTSARLAIDGNRDGNFVHGSVTHSAIAPSGVVSGDSAPWLEVDLRTTRNIGRVMVYNRTDGSSHRLAGARVELSLDPCNNPARRVVRDEGLTVFNRHLRVPPHVNGAGFNALSQAVADGRVKRILGGVSPPVHAIDFIEAPAARYVCLRHDVAEFLHVAEVEVYEGEGAENLARRSGVTARQHSTAHDGVASRAIDGNRSGDYAARSVTHTEQVNNAWWEVDLGSEQDIRAIAVHNRTDCCDDRLLGAIVELSRDPCDQATRRITASRAMPVAPLDNAWTRREPVVKFSGGWSPSVSLSRDVPLRRTQFDLSGTPPARYVCVRNPGYRALSLAEVEVFGHGTATTPPPEPLPTVAAALVTTPAAVPVTPPAMTAVTTGSSTNLTVSFGPLGSVACTLTPRGAEFDLSCANGPAVAMVGSVSGSSYDLTSTAGLSYASLTSASWFPDALKGSNNLFGLVGGMFMGTTLKLGLDQTRGFYLTGTLDLAALPGSGALRDAVDNVLSTLGRLPGFTTAPRFDLVPTYSQSGVGLSFRLTVLETCLGPDAVPHLGTAFKFDRGALVFALGVGQGGLTMTAGLEGRLYVKPTGRDPWLMVTPGIDLGLTTKGGTVTVRGALSGACAESCASTCGCLPSQCATPWSPLGMSGLSLRSGFVEVGVDTAGAVPLPSVSAAFEDARVGDLSGAFAVAIDPKNSRLGFRFGAKRLPLLAALEVFGGASGLGSVVPRELSINNPLISFATAPMTIHDSPVPKGLRVRGGVDLGGLGLKGSIDAVIDPPGAINPVAVASGGVSSAVPSGRLALAIEVPDIAGAVMKLGGLPSFVKTMIRGAFWVNRLELGISFGANNIGVSAAGAFRLLGESYSFDFSFGASWNLDALLKKLAEDVAGKVAGVAQVAYEALRDVALTAYNESSAALRSGAAVVINGIMTAGSIAIDATADALGTVAGFATKVWRAINVFGW